MKVPVYAVGGYADGYTNPIFRMMQNLKCPRKALVGPWAHKYPHFASPAPRIGFLQECLRWWDQHLKGVDTGIMDEPMIRAWVREPAPPNPTSIESRGRWVSAPDWPSPVTKEEQLHVSPTGLSATPSQTPIEIDCPETAGAASQLWCMYGAVPDGPLDQALEEGRMATFDTPPLAEDMEILGFPMLHAQVASDVPQANLAAVLSLVAPDGEATLISFGTLNLTHRDSHETPQALPIGQPVDATVQLNVVGQRIPAGYKLRLALSQAYWPLIFPSQHKAKLTLSDAKLVLPLHDPAQDGPALAAFGPPEGARPLETRQITAGTGHRKLTLNFDTGIETHSRHGDTGKTTHLHTGMTVRYDNEDRFEIHPRDPNSAVAHCSWVKEYSRDGWEARVESFVNMEALSDIWRVTAQLKAFDAAGEVMTRDWQEDIPRDHV